jgi:iron-sulfur cluster assembly protein
MVVITQNAARAVREAIVAQGLHVEETFIRVAVRGGGCSGLTYELTFDTEPKAGDAVAEKDGVRLLIDPKSQVVLAGTTLDYSSGLNGKGFVLSKPNAAGTCGCGGSFSA